MNHAASKHGIGERFLLVVLFALGALALILRIVHH
jgi:hypothetical protein